MAQSPINILRKPDGQIAVIVGTKEQVEQALVLPEQMWWKIMGQITQLTKKETK